MVTRTVFVFNVDLSPKAKNAKTVKSDPYTYRGIKTKKKSGFD